MQFSLLTPHKKLFENVEISELFAPGYKGTLDILEGHANIVTSLETGLLKWRNGPGDFQVAFISTGTLEIFNGQITVLAEVSELAEEISIDRAKEAEIKARQKLDEGGLDEGNFKKYQLKLQRALTRQSIASL